MFTSVSTRAASAYQRVAAETGGPHQLVLKVYEGLLSSLANARAAMARGDMQVKGEQIFKAIRIIEEGLKPALDLEKGGDLAANLKGLYGYCTLRLTEANHRNDDVALLDVIHVIEPLAQGWKQIGGQVPA